MARLRTDQIRLAVAALALLILAALAGSCTSTPTEERETPGESSKPAVASSGCVNCHASKENVKNAAAPPPPVVKSAEQDGEG